MTSQYPQYPAPPPGTNGPSYTIPPPTSEYANFVPQFTEAPPGRRAASKPQFPCYPGGYRTNAQGLNLAVQPYDFHLTGTKRDPQKRANSEALTEAHYPISPTFGPNAANPAPNALIMCGPLLGTGKLIEGKVFTPQRPIAWATISPHTIIPAARTTRAPWPTQGRPTFTLHTTLPFTLHRLHPRRPPNQSHRFIRRNLQQACKDSMVRLEQADKATRRPTSRHQSSVGRTQQSPVS